MKSIVKALILAVVLGACVSTDPTPSQKVRNRYDAVESKLLIPMLREAIAFRTYEGNDAARQELKQWLGKVANEFGFVSRDAGTVYEVELPGPPSAPVLGLIVHGDVQPVEEAAWSVPPFSGEIRDGLIYGRGVADDKGPLVQALLAMRALEESGLTRTHTIRLLVGMTEESDANDIPEYLKTHKPPDYSLVLDSAFPVVVGEKAWDALAVSTPLAERGANRFPYVVRDLQAGLSPSIVPDRSQLTLDPTADGHDWAALIRELRSRALPEGTRLELEENGRSLVVRVKGKSVHAGMNLEQGRNALVALANLMDGLLPAGGANDLLSLSREAGRDLQATGLGLTEELPIWGRYASNVAMVKAGKKNGLPTLTINIRRIPPRNTAQIRDHVRQFVEEFNRRQGSNLQIAPEDSYYQYDDEPLVFKPEAPLIQRLLRIYERATGEKAEPAISGGGTYAKRLPNSIAFGMWFPGKPYTGHDVDENISLADLERGSHVLIEALVDIATGPPVEGEPFPKVK